MIVVSKSWNVLSIHHGRISKAAFVNCFLVFAELWTASYVLLCIPKTTIALHKLTQCNIEQGVIGFLFICTRRTEMLSWARILPTFFCICFIFQIAKKTWIQLFWIKPSFQKSSQFYRSTLYWKSLNVFMESHLWKDSNLNHSYQFR